MCGPPSSAGCTGMSANFGSWPASSAAWPRVPGGLVVRGEAGIGKSALLAAAAGLAADSGARVHSATGIQAEARLPFAGLHQLLRPVLPLAERLPSRQRGALQAAFGMADAEPAEPFLIGLAALEVISDAAASSPVLLITDDAQWLDEASCAVLSFVARRLAAESAALGYAVLPEGTARFYHRRDLRYLHVAGSMILRWPSPSTRRARCRNSTGSRALRGVSSAASPKRVATARSGCPQDR